MQEENFEYIKLHVRHPKSFGESGSKAEAHLIIRSEQDDMHIEHASSQGWRIMATSVFNNDNLNLEIIHMQRSSLHPKFSQRTFSDEYWEQMSKEKEHRMKIIMDQDYYN